MKKILLIAALAACLSSCGGNKEGAAATAEADSTATAAQAQAPATKSAEEVAKLIAAMPRTDIGIIQLNADSVLMPGIGLDKVTIVDFSATWCVPCKRFAPEFESVASHNTAKANFISADVDLVPFSANAFGIKGVPTVVIIDKSGKVVKQFEGIEEIYPAAAFSKAIEPYL